MALAECFTAVPVRLATSADVPALSAMLARAFADDPFFLWLVKKNPEAFYRVQLQLVSLPKKHVYCTDDCSGAALWFPPGEWKMGLIDEAKQLPQLLSVVGGLFRIPKVLSGVKAVQDRKPTAPHWYLYILGVDPSRQKQGLGSALLQPTLERCDRDGVPAYLETANPKTMPLYRRHGFEVTGEVQVPHGGPPVWLLWRQPRAR